MRRRSALLGRDEELADLERLVADWSLPGMVIAGPAGVGKSRLSQAALEIGAERGLATARTLATRATATVPLGAFAPLIGDLDVRPAQVLTQVRERIAEHALGGRMLILVDDAHLLDDVSAATLPLLADDPRICPIVAVRTGESAPDPVTSMWKDLGAPRLDLGPLARDAADRLAETVAGGPIDEPSHVMLRRAARGNPLAVIELVVAATDHGQLADEHGIARLRGELGASPRLGDVVARRLDDLHDSDHDTLALVALGAPLALAVFERLHRLASLRTLERRGLVAIEAGDDVDTVDPAVHLGHPLYGEIVLERIGEIGRRSMLRVLTDDLAPRVAHADDELRLATWSLGAGLDPPPDLLGRAARRAWQRSDHVTTVRLADAGWSRAPDAELGHLLGYALGRTGHHARADEVLAHAWTLAADSRARLQIGHTRGENLFRGLADVDRSLTWSHEVERHLDDLDRRELRAHRATMYIQAGDLVGGLALAEELLDDEDHPRAFVTAAYAAGLGLPSAGRCDHAIAVAERALPVHQRIWYDDLHSTEPGIHHVTRTLALLEAGRLHEADQLTEMGVHVAAQSGRWYGFGFFALLRAQTCLRRGLVGQAERWAREAVPALLDSGYPATARWALATAANACALRGEVDSAEAALVDVDQWRELTPVRLYEGLVDDARGWTLVAAGQPDAARAGLWAAAQRDADAGSVATAAQLAHTLVRVGGASDGAAMLTELADGMQGDLIVARRDHAVAMARSDPAGLEAAGEHFATLDAALDAADAFAAAAVLRARGGRPRAATASARRAWAAAERTDGASTPALRALRALPALQGEPLTDREREVAELAAAGLASLAIGERLHISRRTVDNHLQQVYRKVGVRRREELAGALALPDVDPQVDPESI